MGTTSWLRTAAAVSAWTSAEKARIDQTSMIDFVPTLSTCRFPIQSLIFSIHPRQIQQKMLLNRRCFSNRSDPAISDFCGRARVILTSWNSRQGLCASRLRSDRTKQQLINQPCAKHTRPAAARLQRARPHPPHRERASSCAARRAVPVPCAAEPQGPPEGPPARGGRTVRPRSRSVAASAARQPPPLSPSLAPATPPPAARTRACFTPAPAWAPCRIASIARHSWWTAAIASASSAAGRLRPLRECVSPGCAE